MECPNDECFCDGSCYDNEAFNTSWEWYEDMCEDLGLYKENTTHNILDTTQPTNRFSGGGTTI